MNLAPLVAIALGAFLVGTVQAADQSLLGATFQVKNPKTPDKRKVQVRATEKASVNTIVGNPVTSGATLTIRANGTTPSEQVFPLPQGSNAKGKPFWSGDPIKGFTYSDAKGEQGAVSKVQLKKSGKGVFSLHAQASGKLHPLNVTPPNVGTDACAYLEIGGGDAYSVKFGAGDGTIVNQLAKEYSHKKVTVEGSCAPTCTPGAPGCGWQDGDLNTRTESDWDDLTNWTTDFNSVYNSTFGVVEVGIVGSAGFSMRFGGTTSVQAYIPTAGVPGALTADLLNPTSSSAGIFGGDVLSLLLDVDFSNAGLLGGTSGLELGALTLCNMSDASLDGRTVTNFTTLVNSLLGGNAGSGYSIAALQPITAELTGAFHNGTPTSWAQQHLVNGTCP